jgi:hypothetical protein
MPAGVIHLLVIRGIQKFRLMYLLGNLSCLIILLLTVGCSSFGSPSLAEQAERLAEESRTEDAIEAYRRHIEQRLNTSGRPDWENPYFYLLRIADLQLTMSKPDEALKTCVEAESKGVETSLLSDRYRAIAAWYIDHGDLQASFELLRRYRDRDPLLFDSMLDRVGRSLTANERPRTSTSLSAPRTHSNPSK